MVVSKAQVGIHAGNVFAPTVSFCVGKGVSDVCQRPCCFRLEAFPVAACPAESTAALCKRSPIQEDGLMLDVTACAGLGQ